MVRAWKGQIIPEITFFVDKYIKNATYAAKFESSRTSAKDTE